MAKILSFIDHQKRIMEEEDQRLSPDFYILMNVEVLLFIPTLAYLKNRKFTRCQAKRLSAILSQAFEVETWEAEPNISVRLEFECGLTKSSFLPKFSEKGDFLLHALVSSIQQGTFSRYRAIHIL